MIKQIDIINISHTDFGFTDHQVVCNKLLRKYIDIAIDKIIATIDKSRDKKFYWTAETLIPVLDWWEQADNDRRNDFKKAVDSGQFEATALPLNNTPFLNKEQWEQMLNWVPSELWELLNPKVVMQNDVNGFPRAGALVSLDRGLNYIWSGINPVSGGAPFKQPSVFWWKMPDGRRMFVWLNIRYGDGIYLFEEEEWRRGGPLPEAADCLYWLPAKNDILKTDEKSLRKANKVCQKKINTFEEYYPYDRLLISITNQWRIDTDPPLFNITEFVNHWNYLGLKPELKFTTASQALDNLKKEIGDQIPEYEGEWTDWWANGTVSTPVEVGASRRAKRLIHVIKSPVWDKETSGIDKEVEKSLKELCMFNEHTWGALESISEPDSVQTRGQFASKSIMAYRPLERLKFTLSRVVRNNMLDKGRGLYLINPSREPQQGWQIFPIDFLRGDYRAVEDKEGYQQNLIFEKGWDKYTRPEAEQEVTHKNSSRVFPDNRENMQFKFWVELKPYEIKRYKFIKDKVTNNIRRESSEQLTFTTNQLGWPDRVQWSEGKVVNLTDWGKLLSLEVKDFNARWILNEIREENKLELRKKHLQKHITDPVEKTNVKENKHTIHFVQRFKHPALNWFEREIEVYKKYPRINVKIHFDKKVIYNPQTFYVIFDLPLKDRSPLTSNGGNLIVPGDDQLPDTCKEYYAIDGWVYYQNKNEECIWTSEDAPLVSFGGPNAWSGIKRIFSPHRLYSMIYNNFWFTNFKAESSGIMEFNYNFEMRDKNDKKTTPGKWGKGLMTKPVKILNPDNYGDSIYINHLIQN